MKYRTPAQLLLMLLLVQSVIVWATTFDEDDFAILDLQYQRNSIMGGLEAYIHQGSNYLLLVDLVSALELNITVTADEAKGFINKQDQTFLLEHKLSDWFVTINGETTQLNNDDLVIHEGLLYVKDKLIESWFGIRFNLSYSLLKLEFTATKTLPVLERLKRANRKIGRVNVTEGSKNPLQETPYSLFELPSIDFRATSFVNDRKDRETENKNFYTLISRGDLGYMNTSFFFNGSHEEDIRNVSIRMDRFDHRGEILGPVKLSQVSVGDLSHPSVPLAPPSFGRGVIIGNDISTQQSSRNITTIEGDYHPGQEVELYFNNSLIGYQVIPEDGHYKFEDVILFLGNNSFVLKFYGINGTVETKTRNILVGANPEDEGKIKYTVSVSEPNTKVIDVSDDDDEKSEEESHLQSVINARYSFNKYLSFSAGIQSTEEFEEKINYGNIGFQSYLFGTTFSADATSRDGELIGSSLGLNGSLFGTHFRLGTTIYEDAFSLKDPSVAIEDINILKQEYTLALSARYGKESYTFSGSRTEREVGHEERYRFGVSGKLWGTGWSNTNEYFLKDNGTETDTDTDSENEELEGGLFFSRYIHPMSLRLRLGYELIPESELKSAGFSLSFKPTSKSTLNFNVDHNVQDNKTDYEFSTSWKFKYLQITPRLRYDGDENTFALIDFSTSLGKRNGRFGNYYNLDPNQRSSSGSIRARLFDDINGNGTFEQGEDLLSGGIIRATQYRSKATSNEGGIAWIEHTKSWLPTDITYEENTLNASSMRYSGDPIAVAVRPGKVTEIDLPFTRTGDIDGTVFRKLRNGQKKPIRGAIVIAKNSAGDIIAENRSDFDGYFSFDGLLPGNYSLGVRNETLVSTTRSNIIITNKGEFIDNIDLIISERIVKDDVFPVESKEDIQKLNQTRPPEAIKLDTPIIPEKKSFTTKAFPLPEPSPVSATNVPIIKSEQKEQHKQETKPQLSAKPDSTALPKSSQQVSEQPVFAPRPTNTKNAHAKPFPDAEPLPIANDFTRSSSFRSLLKAQSKKRTKTKLNTSSRKNVDLYAIKFGSFSNKKFANDSIKKLEYLGKSIYTEVVRTPKGTFTRIFVGPIKSISDAERIKNSINRRYNSHAFIVPFEA